MHQLALRLIAKAKVSDDPIDEPLRALNWWYPEDEEGEPKTEAVLAEINGWYTEPSDGRRRSRVRSDDRAGNPHHGAQVDGYPRTQS